MANKRKEALVHFPLDVDIFDDEKITIAEELVDPNGYDALLRAQIDKVLVRLYCFIYKNGYQLPWNDKAIIHVAKNIGGTMNATLLKKCVAAMVGAELFDRHMLEEKGVLTSHGIQAIWLRVVTSARRVHQTIDPNYILLTPDEVITIKHPKSVSATEKGKNVAGNPKSATDRSKNHGAGGTQKGKNKVKSTKNVAGNQQSATENVNQGEKNLNNRANTVNKSGNNHENVAESEKPATDLVENVAESEKPFTFNNNNKRILSNTLINDNENKNSENVAESEKPATDLVENVAESDIVDVKVVISATDKSYYPIEICLYNLTHPNFSTTFDRICSSYYMDENQIMKWGLAFNRMLIMRGETKRPMIGTEGWLTFLGNWIKTNEGYSNIDPDTLYTKYAAKKRSAATNGNVVPNSRATEQQVNDFYFKKK